MIELGGNIKLSGFNDIDHGSLVIIKKMVGNYAKNISNLYSFQELILYLKDRDNNGYALKAELVSESKVLDAEDSAENLFFAINKVLSRIKEKVNE